MKFNKAWIVTAVAIVIAVVALVRERQTAWQRKNLVDKSEVAAQFEDLFARENMSALHRGIHVLKIAERHRECFEDKELQYWLQHVDGWKKDVERIAIPYLHQKGETQAADQERKSIKEASALLTRLGWPVDQKSS
jgi:hypothetical protein